MGRPQATGNARSRTPQASDGPVDPLEATRARRRDPNERWLSRSSGILLLVMITQAAFGYSLVGLSTAPWVRHTHLALALVVAALAVAVHVLVRRLPWRGPREQVLRGLAAPLVFLVFLQLVMGAMFSGLLPGPSGDLVSAHVGVGLLVTFLVALVHILAIGPSILLSAQREYESSRERLEQAKRKA